MSILFAVYCNNDLVSENMYGGVSGDNNEETLAMLPHHIFIPSLRSYALVTSVEFESGLEHLDLLMA